MLAACALSAVPGVGAATLLRIAQGFGSLEAALAQGARALLDRAGELRLSAAARDYLSQDPDLEKLGAWAVDAAAAVGAHVVLPGDAAYPARLRQLPNAPPLLYVRGQLAPAAPRAAVVGSRDADEEALGIARAFGEALARAGVQVISGGARGIDTAAHEGACGGQGATVAVLGSGIDVDYPEENAQLFQRIVQGGGAVITELPPGTPPAAGNFPRRNRIVAGLADAVVVVRAALRSGALITADHAAGLGRPIFAVPGSARDPLAEGSNALLRNKAARPVPGPLELFRAMGWPAGEGATRTDAAGRASEPFAVALALEEGPPPEAQVLDQDGARLWALLDERTPAHVDDLAHRSQMAATQALRKLAELELKG
ncbi:MAG: DNA-processing protein DprA, partial [Deltaproteobacteria bacterium]